MSVSRETPTVELATGSDPAICDDPLERRAAELYEDISRRLEHRGPLSYNRIWGEVSLDVAAEICRRAPGTLVNWRKQGRGPPARQDRVRGGRVWYPLRDLARWLAEQEFFTIADDPGRSGIAGTPHRRRRWPRER